MGSNQVQLLAIPTNTNNPPIGFFPSAKNNAVRRTEWSNLDSYNKAFLHRCENLSGAKNAAVVEFNVSNIEENVTIQVIDKNGNITRQEFDTTNFSLQCFNPFAPAPLAYAEAFPAETFLLSNYPNPFNPETWIPYQLAEAADVKISLYSVNGTLIRTLALGHQSIGVYHNRSRAAHWDGRNDFGEPVASGVYFYTLTAGEFTATRKMIIQK